VLPGVYRHCAATVNDDLMMRAGLLWVGRSGVVSGSWAAWLHEFVAVPRGPVALTVPRACALRSNTWVTIRRRDLQRVDVCKVRGIPVVSRALAALECAHLPQGSDVVDRALQRHVSVAQLDDALDRLAGGSGVVVARKLVDDNRQGTVSPPERELLKALRSASLHDVAAGVKVIVGGVPLWLDFAVERIRLAIEVDGYSVHIDPEVYHRDRAKQNLLVAHDWTVLRYPPRQIRADTGAVVDEIAAMIRNLGG
jgi:very-short-patch-repair endonuclease